MQINLPSVKTLAAIAIVACVALGIVNATNAMATATAHNAAAHTTAAAMVTE
jgi:hypothetical protein